MATPRLARLACLLAIAGNLIPSAIAALENLPPSTNQKLSALDVTWSAPGGEMASMPIGNGELTSNVWVEENGDLAFYLGKSDAWNELSCLLKIGRVRVTFTPALPTKNFCQRLDLQRGEVIITSGEGTDRVTLRAWVDANHPVMHIAQDGGLPRACSAKIELWRTQDEPLRDAQKSHTEDDITASGATFMRLADTVIDTKPGEPHILWCHRNTASIYPVNLKTEHLESLLSKYPDPLINRTFGAVAYGSGMIAAAPLLLESQSSSNKRALSFTVLTEQTATLGDWVTKAKALAVGLNALSPDATRSAHLAWWEQFWNRSHLFVSGDKDADIVTLGYNLQRYMIAASSRGKYPPKFNGGAFTVNLAGHCPFATNPDFRAWGGNCFWFQNNRFLCWPSLATGDFDLMQPFFTMYREMLPFRRDVTHAYFGHDGAHFAETFHFWGSHAGRDFGWKNPSNTPQSLYIRWYWQGGLELSTMMLDYYAYTHDESFAKQTLLPIADAVVTFYDQHWNRDDQGEIRFDPTAALESYDAVNDAPTIAGLRSVLPRMLALPPNLTTASQRAAWKKSLSGIPPLPTTTTGNKPVLAPADKFWGERNIENPELYAVFPYRLYGYGLPDLQIARDTYSLRRNRHQYCWSQDCIDAALLGYAGDAKSRTVEKFSAPSTPQKFPAFWNPNWNFDWTPDMDHGGSAMMALSEMLMQCPGNQIILLPAWPENWSADFKLHAPHNTIVTGRVENGRILHLSVTPESRRNDVKIIAPPPPALSEKKPATASSE